MQLSVQIDAEVHFKEEMHFLVILVQEFGINSLRIT